MSDQKPSGGTNHTGVPRRNESICGRANGGQGDGATIVDIVRSGIEVVGIQDIRRVDPDQPCIAALALYVPATSLTVLPKLPR